MATLDVIIAENDGAGTVYNIKANSVDNLIDRKVVAMPLPGTVATGQPTIFMMDLGMMTEIVSISGVIGSSDVSPSRANLENVARLWWRHANVADKTGLTRITIEGRSWYGIVQDLRIDDEGGEAGRVDYTLTFVTSKFPAHV